MAINPIGPVGESPLPAPSNGDRRSITWTPRTTSTVSSANGDVEDSVLVSDAARDIAAAAAHEEVELNLSPAELRAMTAPKSADKSLKSTRTTDDSSSNTEERHVH